MRSAAGDGSHVSVRGPAPAPLERLRNRYRWQILLASPQTRTLREALRTGRFRLDLQPILPLQGGSKSPHFEVLLRMLADDGHSIPPEKFLSAAARYQLMPAIDRWVIENAIKLLGEHAALLRQHSACFTINIAGPSLAQPDFDGIAFAHREVPGPNRCDDRGRFCGIRHR